MIVNDYATANLLAIDVYANERARLDADLLADLVGIVISPLFTTQETVYFAEFVYANSSKFLKTSRQKAADVADFATRYQFYGLGIDQRGFKIAASLRGETVEDAPEPLAQFDKRPPVSMAPPMPEDAL